MSSLDEPPSTADSSASEPNHRLSAQRRQGMKMSVVEGSFSIAHVTLTGPTFLTGYLLLNGASDLQLSVMLAIPYFLMIFQLAAAYLTSRLGNRKGLCSVGIVCFRGVHVILAILPFIPGLRGEERLWIIFSVLMFSHLTFMLLANTWWHWMADLVPQRIRGRYFGFRAGLSLVLGTLWSLGGGALLDYYKSEGDPAFGFCILFCLASACALAGLFFLRRQYEPPMDAEPVPSLRQILSILKNDNFRRASLWFFIWNFGVGLMIALSGKHMLVYMGMSFQQVMLYAVIVNLIGFACAKQWGKLMDIVGTRTVLLLGGLVAASVPFVWLFTKPGTLWPIWFDAVAAGIFVTGMNVAAVNLPLIVTPQKNRLYYLAIFATISGLGIGLAAISAGKIAMMLEGVRWTVPGLGHELINYHVIFAFSAFFKIGSMWMLIKFQEENGRSLAEAWAKIGRFLLAPFYKRQPVSVPPV